MSLVAQLYRNPWSEIISDNRLLAMLMDAGRAVEQQLQVWINAGETDEGRVSYGGVLLLPPSMCVSAPLADNVLATIAVGPEGEHYIPNGHAKAEDRRRIGPEVDEYMERAKAHFGSTSFAWSGSAEYRGFIGGGSGQRWQQDRDLTMIALEDFFDEICMKLDGWLKTRRDTGNQRWFNDQDAVPTEFATILNREPIAMDSDRQFV